MLTVLSARTLPAARQNSEDFAALLLPFIESSSSCHMNLIVVGILIRSGLLETSIVLS